MQGYHHRGYSLFSIHMAEGTLTTFETWTVRATMTAKTWGTYTIATGIANVPCPILGELLSATLTRNPHKRYCFKLILLCCKDKHFSLNHQGFEGKSYPNMFKVGSCKCWEPSLSIPLILITSSWLSLRQVNSSQLSVGIMQSYSKGKMTSA